MQLTGAEGASLVVDEHLVVASLVQDNNVIGVTVVDNAIGFQTRNTGRVKGALVLPGAERDHALDHDLKKKE